MSKLKVDRLLRVSIEEAHRSNTDKRFSCSIVDHVKFLIQCVVLNAEHEIKILSEKFYEGFYSYLEDDFINFLKRDSKNRIKLITARDLEDSQLYRTICGMAPNQIELVKLNTGYFPTDNGSKEIVDFVVNDNNAFVYEYSQKFLSKGVLGAFSNFNNEKENGYLNRVFDMLFSFRETNEEKDLGVVLEHLEYLKSFPHKDFFLQTTKRFFALAIKLYGYCISYKKK